MLLYADCPGCGVQVKGNTHSCHQSCGFIVSPGYSAGYTNNARHTWVITVTEGLYVELSFTHFDVHESPIEACQRDVVTVTDFTLNKEPILIGR